MTKLIGASMETQLPIQGGVSCLMFTVCSYSLKVLVEAQRIYGGGHNTV